MQISLRLAVVKPGIFDSGRSHLDEIHEEIKRRFRFVKLAFPRKRFEAVVHHAATKSALKSAWVGSGIIDGHSPVSSEFLPTTQAEPNEILLKYLQKYKQAEALHVVVASFDAEGLVDALQTELGWTIDCGKTKISDDGNVATIHYTVKRF